MSQGLRSAFITAKKHSRPVFVAYVTAGYPEETDTVEILLGLQSGGADIIELGIPFSDPIADGPTIQESSFIALQNKIDIRKCLNMVKTARQKGLKVPIVFMGYYNPFLIYGELELMKDCVENGVNGFIVVDLPPEEAVKFRDLSDQFALSYIPLITPTTSESRIKQLVSVANSFIYVVSVSGVTGARSEVSSSLPELVKKIKKFTNMPLAVGFGVSNREQFVNVGQSAEGVVIGSKIITVIKNAEKSKRASSAKEFAESVTGRKDVVFEENTDKDIVPPIQPHNVFISN
jgi:tryptophan synthase